MKDYKDLIIGHCEHHWGARCTAHRWPHEPHASLPPLRAEFRVLEFAGEPSQTQSWRYASCCMSAPEDVAKLELFMYAPRQSRESIELLTVVAHYHTTGHRLGLHHTVNFGRPWVAGSSCEFGFISLPYLEGPQLERFEASGNDIRFLWLIPITKEEREYKKKAGAEALETRFEDAQFNYLDPFRASVV